MDEDRWATALDLVPLDIATEVRARWPIPCEDAFHFLRRRDWLACVIQSGGLPPTRLTFAAEIMGWCSNTELVRATLEPLLRHEKAYVREGADLGLTIHAEYHS